MEALEGVKDRRVDFVVLIALLGYGITATIGWRPSLAETPGP